jgi:hypothetical protein
MGYQLECFALDHAELRAVMGSGRGDILRQVVAAEARLFVTNPGEPWRAALRELVMGERGRLAAAQAADPSLPGLPATPAEAAAMVALLRWMGHRAGELIHNSRAGPKFRAMFDPGFAPRQFADPRLAPQLLGRPLGGLVNGNYPCWGGLAHAELVRLQDGSGPEASPSDPDQAQWLFELGAIVADVWRWQADLVTLYL